MRIAVALLLILAASPAQAASFDCGKAATTREKAICANPALSVLDDKLASAYAAALKPLSPAGGDLLRQGQREWLASLSAACPTAEAACLETALTDRLGGLSDTVQRRGPWLFQRVDHFAATAKRRRHLSFLRIDQPPTPVAQAWNKAMDRPAPELDSDCASGEVERHDGLIWADARYLSVSSEDILTCSDAAHPNDTVTAVTLVVDGAQLRPLRPEDFFAPGKPWADTLVKAALTDLTAVAHDGGVDDMTFDPDALRNTALDPRNWLVDDKGLTLLFPAESVAPHAFGNQVVLLPWDRLHSLLAPQAILPK